MSMNKCVPIEIDNFSNPNELFVISQGSSCNVGAFIYIHIGAPLKFENALTISHNAFLGKWLLINDGIKVEPS